MNETHMLENMNAYSFTLDEEDMKQLSTRPQDMCSVIFCCISEHV